jgi:hypothetical protein
MENSIDLIKKEREEQIMKHKFSIAYDVDKNTEGQLVEGALALLTLDFSLFPETWDKTMCEHMFNKTYEERLIVAATCIAAEIDRIRCLGLAKFIRCPNG